MISGIGVHYLGHGHPALLGAAFDAAMQDVIMQGNLEQNSQSVDLARVLIALARRGGSRLEHCFFSTSGAMANENALKILLQKKHPAGRMLAFEHAFAGRTLALAQLTDKAAYREGLPEILAVDFVPFFDAGDPAGSRQRALVSLKSHLSRHPQMHAGMCMELIQGEGGYYAGDAAFFAALVDVLKAANIPLWVDEVQTFGRTSEPFAFQTFGLHSAVDVVTIGKLTQVCATFFTDAMKPRPGLISQTFTGSTSAMFAARAIIEQMMAGDFFRPNGRIARLHRLFVDRLQQIATRHPTWVRGPFGMGAMIAFIAFDGGEAAAKALLQALFHAGVIAFVAGSSPARVRFLPPVGAMTEDDVDAVCKTLEATLGNVAPTVASPGPNVLAVV
jgi:4-aminobutyrate aminotransferase-like enzyme